MNTPELPDPIFDNDEDLTPEIEPPAEQEPVYNPLFENLVPQQPETRLAGRLSFADAMPQMGMSSVFDIIRQPFGAHGLTIVEPKTSCPSSPKPASPGASASPTPCRRWA
ncbi:hypothetical protein ASF66_20500 [Pseudomonas sp. Leaf129]|nr:hypothetical protein ASF66_20500 [Pseudomonas sp. Leaf129]